MRLIAAAVFLAAAPAMAQEVAPNPLNDPVPAGAPSGDYEFVGWCAGALATHMQLYGQVKPELDAIAIRWDTVDEDAQAYAQQQLAGRQAMAEFERAMRAAEAASNSNIAPNGQVAIQSGSAMWSGIRQVSPRDQAYSWLNWELPPRCQAVATRLEQRSTLLGAALNNPTAAAPAPEAGE
jgi:hypothetical protein